MKQEPLVSVEYSDSPADTQTFLKLYVALLLDELVEGDLDDQPGESPQAADTA